MARAKTQKKPTEAVSEAPVVLQGPFMNMTIAQYKCDRAALDGWHDRAVKAAKIEAEARRIIKENDQIGSQSQSTKGYWKAMDRRFGRRV